MKKNVIVLFVIMLTFVPEASDALSVVGMPSVNELIAKKEGELKSTVPSKDEYQAIQNELEELRKEKEALGYKRK